ncbi:MAG: LysE family transporter [Anaerolineae bacterium]|nr:LysE family transporter [Anaerolineae bacterium]MDQ7037358.1 LysE family transporter [Anaerolineae bacterium]
MPMFESIILPAISLGFSAASIPGPLQAYLLNVTLRYGWKRGLLVILAPLIVDGPVILVTVFLLNGLPSLVIQAIRVLGGLLLLWIAWNAWKQLQAGVQFADDDAEDRSEETSKNEGSVRRIMATAVTMNIFSPGPYLFWATVTGPLLLQALEISNLATIGMLLGFYGTFLGGLACLVFFFNRLGQVNQNLTRVILMLTIALLTWFGSGLIAEAFSLSAIHTTMSWIGLAISLLIISYRLLNQRKGQFSSR